MKRTVTDLSAVSQSAVVPPQGSVILTPCGIEPSGAVCNSVSSVASRCMTRMNQCLFWRSFLFRSTVLRPGVRCWHFIFSTATLSLKHWRGPSGLLLSCSLRCPYCLEVKQDDQAQASIISGSVHLISWNLLEFCTSKEEFQLCPVFTFPCWIPDVVEENCVKVKF